MRSFTFILLSTVIIFISCDMSDRTGSVGDNMIKPWGSNPAYWQYKGQPVLLLGATDNDNLFQNMNAESHLDSLKAIGGNYIRNVMSDRDPGDERAFAIDGSGKYDLKKWNEGYWKRFDNLLRLASEREIIVQVEIWDRFDHSQERWLSDPYNPLNNINYSYAEAGLDTLYPNPSNRAQNFFLSVPELENNGVLLEIQKSFVLKLLSVSLNYDNVLYCIDNETTGPEEWGVFWAGFLRDNSLGKELYITQMWNNWDLKTDMHKWTLDHPERYNYIDISQNSHNAGQLNWELAQYVFGYTGDKPRPVNSTKIYGSDNYGAWLDRGINTEHAVQTFFRNIIGGFASSRFHRPPHGLGLSLPAVNSIRTIRRIEEYVKMWEIAPRMDLLITEEDNMAYLSAREGAKYLVYFTGRGKALLDLTGHNGEFLLMKTYPEDAGWGEAETIEGGGLVALEAECDKNCFFVIIKK